MRFQFYTNNYRPLRKAGNGRCGFPREKHTNYLSPTKKVRLENIHAGSIKLTDQFIFNMCITYIHWKTISEKETMKLKESMNWYLGGFEDGKDYML